MRTKSEPQKLPEVPGQRQQVKVSRRLRKLLKVKVEGGGVTEPVSIFTLGNALLREIIRLSLLGDDDDDDDLSCFDVYDDRSYVVTCARDLAGVSRRFYKLVRPYLWSTVLWRSPVITEASVTALGKNAKLRSYVRRLVIRLPDTVKLDNAILDRVIKRLTSVDSLFMSRFLPLEAFTALPRLVNLSMGTAHVADLAVFVTANPSLRQVWIEELVGFTDHPMPLGQITHLGLGQPGLKAQQVFAPALLVLDIFALLADSDSGVVLDPYKTFPSLQHLTIRSWPNFVDSLFQFMPSSLLSLTIRTDGHEEIEERDCETCQRQLPAIAEVLDLYRHRLSTLVQLNLVGGCAGDGDEVHDKSPSFVSVKSACKSVDLDLKLVDLCLMPSRLLLIGPPGVGLSTGPENAILRLDHDTLSRILFFAMDDVITDTFDVEEERKRREHVVGICLLHRRFYEAARPYLWQVLRIDSLAKARAIDRQLGHPAQRRRLAGCIRVVVIDTATFDLDVARELTEELDELEARGPQAFVSADDEEESDDEDESEVVTAIEQAPAEDDDVQFIREEINVNRNDAAAVAAPVVIRIASTPEPQPAPRGPLQSWLARAAAWVTRSAPQPTDQPDKAEPAVSRAHFASDKLAECGQRFTDAQRTGDVVREWADRVESLEPVDRERWFWNVDRWPYLADTIECDEEAVRARQDDYRIRLRLELADILPYAWQTELLIIPDLLLLPHRLQLPKLTDLRLTTGSASLQRFLALHTNLHRVQLGLVPSMQLSLSEVRALQFVDPIPLSLVDASHLLVLDIHLQPGRTGPFAGHRDRFPSLVEMTLRGQLSSRLTAVDLMDWLPATICTLNIAFGGHDVDYARPQTFPGLRLCGACAHYLALGDIVESNALPDGLEDVRAIDRRANDEDFHGRNINALTASLNEHGVDFDCLSSLESFADLCAEIADRNELEIKVDAIEPSSIARCEDYDIRTLLSRQP